MTRVLKYEQLIFSLSVSYATVQAEPESMNTYFVCVNIQLYKQSLKVSTITLPVN